MEPTVEQRTARDFLDVCASEEEAQAAVLFAMGQPGTSPDFWLSVYLHIETLALIRRAIAEQL